MFTDGLAAFNSNSKDVWPICTQVANLSPAIRTHPMNMWCHGSLLTTKTHDELDMFMSTFVMELEYLRCKCNIRIFFN